MTEQSDLAAALVSKLEGAQTRSAAVLRRMAYSVLGELGVDVQKLAADAAESERLAKEAEIERAIKRRKLIEGRIAAGHLKPEQMARAQKQLAKIPDDIKQQRAALRKLQERPKEVWPTAPTPERNRQAGGAPTVEIAAPANGPIPALKRHRYDWPVDQVRSILRAEEYDVASRLRNSYYAAQPRSAVSSYGDPGGGDPYSRVPLAERQEAAGRDFNALFTKLPAEIKLILKIFVLEEPLPGTNRAPTPEEFGRTFGQTRDARRAKGVADGALKAALAMLAAQALEYDAWKAEVKRQQKRIA